MEEMPHITHERLSMESTQRARKSPEAFLASFNTSTVPSGPGCYIMLDFRGKPIYVGKAKDLRARIRNYIHDGDSRYSVKFLMQRVAHIDFLVTNTEKEALLLENSLIKQYKPRYNVRLKDDKTYISLRLNPHEDFPRFTVVRRYKKDGARYFGPYHSAASVRKTMRQIQRLFPLRTCSDHVLHNRTRPCLYYQMGQCSAPCVKYIDREAYHEIVNQVIMVLEGRNDELEKTLRQRIQEHSEALEFEKAAILRDRLMDLQHTVERQRTVAMAGAEDRDVFGLYNKATYTEIQILFYRGGRMTGGRNFSFQQREMPLDELLGSFLMQYYASGAVLPQEIILPLELEESDTLAEILSDQRGSRVQVLTPQRGEKLALVQIANRNAWHSFDEKQLADKANLDTLQQIQRVLQLPKLPERIECFDVSTIQGNKTVASMVVFEKAVASKARYRHYTIRQVEGQDDFAGMREALMRRYTRAIQENDLPDLVLIDGGKGQLNVASAVFQDLGLEDIPHASIAKSRPEDDGAHSPERFFLPGRMNPIVPPQNSPMVLLLARIRDEAHRFAITHHRKQRSKGTLRTSLTSIPGIGPQKARLLLNKMGSVAKIREAQVESLAALPGITKELAQTVHEHLNNKTKAM